jgi:hypothetical protein
LHLTNHNKSKSGLPNFQIKNICLQVYKNLFGRIFFLAGFAGKGVLSDYPTVWLNGSRPVNTLISPSFPSNVLTQQCSILTPKSMFVRI